VIGGGGNHLLGRQIVRTSRAGFGLPPATLPAWLEPVVKLPKAPRDVKAPRAQKPPIDPNARRRIRIPTTAPIELLRRTARRRPELPQIEDHR